MDNIIHVFGNPRIYISTAYMKGIHNLEIGINITVGNRFPVRAFCIGFIDDFIIYICEVLYKSHFVSDIFQISADNIPGHRRTGVPNVRMVIRSYTADVNFCFPRCYRFKYLFFFVSVL